MPRPDPAREQAEKAAAEAARIGGRPSSEPDSVDPEQPDDSQRPLVEAGQGESEGYEQAQRELVEHASHGDQHAARRVLEDASQLGGGAQMIDRGGGEADHERSSECAEDN